MTNRDPTWLEPMKPYPGVTIVIVAAAMRNKEGMVIVSPRHFDVTCHNTLNMLTPEYRKSFMGGREEQGFVDQWGNFYTREQALEIAKSNGQYNRYDSRCTHKTQLFSENLY